MKYFEHKIFVVACCSAMLLLLCNLCACTESTASPDEVAEAKEASGEVVIPAQTVANEQKQYPPVFNGPRLSDDDPRLAAARAAEKITQAIYGDTPNRIYRDALVAGDSVRIRMVEDWNHKGKIWQFDYAQTGGDFSSLVFPQIGKGDEVYELHRKYNLKAGEIFFVEEAIFARRDDQSEVLHYNKYVFENGKLSCWYRDTERYEVNSRYYELAENLFPQISQFDFDTWVNSAFKSPRETLDKLVNIQGVGPNLEAAMDNWIDQAKALDALIVGGELWGGDDYSQPVIWVELGPGRNENGAAYILDWAENAGNIEVYDAMEVGLAYTYPELCQNVGDMVVSLAWAQKIQKRYTLSHLLEPTQGLLYGGMDELLNGGQTEAKRVMADELKWENISNPLYFGSYSGASAFDENGFASWQWSLAGSTEKMIIQKVGDRLYWRAFEGAYH